MGRYDWNREERKRKRKWQRYDRERRRDDDYDDDEGNGSWHGLSQDNLMKSATSGGMMGSLFFWFVIWAFTGFNQAVFWIFLGIAFMQGWGWNSAEGFYKRRKRRRDGRYDADREDRLPVGASGPLDGSAPVEAKADEPEKAVPVDPSIAARLIRESADQRDQLTAAASAADGALGDNLRRIDTASKQVVSALQKDGSNLAHVQRMFTYYLPSAAELLKARRNVVGSGNSAHLAEIDGMFARLAVAFEDFVARINGTDMRSLEIDLRLLEQSLDAEFAPVKKDLA